MGATLVGDGTSDAAVWDRAGAGAAHSWVGAARTGLGTGDGAQVTVGLVRGAGAADLAALGTALATGAGAARLVGAALADTGAGADALGDTAAADEATGTGAGGVALADAAVVAPCVFADSDVALDEAVPGPAAGVPPEQPVSASPAAIPSAVPTPAKGSAPLRPTRSRDRRTLDELSRDRISALLAVVRGWTQVPGNTPQSAESCAVFAATFYVARPYKPDAG